MVVPGVGTIGGGAIGALQGGTIGAGLGGIAGAGVGHGLEEFGGAIGQGVGELGNAIGDGLEGFGAVVTSAFTGVYVYCTSGDDNDANVDSPVENIAEIKVRISDIQDTLNELEEAEMDASLIEQLKDLIKTNEQKRKNMQDRLDDLRQ